MNFGLSFLLPILFLMALAVLVAGLAYMVVRVRAGAHIDLSFRLLLYIYFYAMLILSLVVLAAGLSSLMNAGLASVVGRQFSYSAPADYGPAAMGFPSGSAPADREAILQGSFRSGLAEGLSFTVVGGLIWVLHRWGQGALRRRASGEESALHRIYLAVLLAIFSIGGILALSQGVSDTVRYALGGVADPYAYSSPPGGSLSAAIVFVPIWIYYFTTLWRELRPEGAHA